MPSFVLLLISPELASFRHPSLAAGISNEGEMRKQTSQMLWESPDIFCFLIRMPNMKYKSRNEDEASSKCLLRMDGMET